MVVPTTEYITIKQRCQISFDSIQSTYQNINGLLDLLSLVNVEADVPNHIGQWWTWHSERIDI